jgi:hypothetical protein
MNKPIKSEGEERLVRVAAGPVRLEGNLSLAKGARGVVAHLARQWFEQHLTSAGARPTEINTPAAGR